MQLEAGRVSIDDARKITILEGDVLVTKGSMGAAAFPGRHHRGSVRFPEGCRLWRQDGHSIGKQGRQDEYLDGEAERIEYNTNNEVAEFFRRAWVEVARIRSRVITSGMTVISEKYLVTAGKNGDPKGPPARVRAIINRAQTVNLRRIPGQNWI